MVFATTHEEFTRVSNIDRYITMHRMFAQKVNPELFACFRETKLTIQGNYIGENPPTLAIVGKFKEFLRQLLARLGERSIKSAAVKVVDSLMLVMESLVQDSPSEALRLKHARNKRLEFNIAVVQLRRNRASQLHLDGLKAD